MNFNCEFSSLAYYDGDMRQEPHRYCGLRQLPLPKSNSNVVILEQRMMTKNVLATDLRIIYKSETVDSRTDGKWFCL